MRLCVGTSKGIVLLDPDRAETPLMALAEPSSVWCMAQDSRDPKVIYAGTMGGGHMGQGGGKGSVAVSIDGGRNWKDVTPSGARDEDIWSVASSPAEPGSIFVGTSHARLFRSRERGGGFTECVAFLKIPGRDHWSFPPPPHIPHIRSLSFDPQNPETMYLGVEEGGVFRTRDFGDSFESLNHGIYEDIHTVVADPHNRDRLYATTGRGFYLSEDSGASWQHITRGFNRFYPIPLLTHAEAKGMIHTAAAGGPPPSWQRGSDGASAQLFRSKDGGMSFETISEGFGPTRAMVMRLKADPERTGEFFGVLNDGTVIRSRSAGEAVETIAGNLPPAYDLAVIP
jgi:hypothetical protein